MEAKSSRFVPSCMITSRLPTNNEVPREEKHHSLTDAWLVPVDGLGENGVSHNIQRQMLTLSIILLVIVIRMASTVDFVERWQRFKDADEGKHKFVEVQIYPPVLSCVLAKADRNRTCSTRLVTSKEGLKIRK